MKNAFTCVVFFLMVLCFFVSVDAQTLTPTSSTNLDSFIVKQNVAVVKSADSSSNNLKHKINKAYKQLDKYPLTHPYVNKLDSLKGKIVTGYKKIDSSIFADTGNTIKAAILRQLTTKKADSTNRKPLNEIVAQQKLKLDTVEQKPIVETEKLQPQSAEEMAAWTNIKNGTICLKQNKTKDAIFNYQKALRVANKIHSLVIEEAALKGLSEAYSQNSDTKNALSYFKQYTDVKDSLLRLKTDKALAELIDKYEDEKRQNEITALLLEGELKKSELNKTRGQVEEQKQFILLIVVILCLIVVLTISVFRQYRVKKKNNETLLAQNTIIVEQKKELEESLAYTRSLQETLKEDLEHYMQMALRKQMNPHFIFNSLNSIQSFILQNDKLAANIYLSKFSSLMRKVLENSQHHFITLAKEIEVLKLYIELEEQRFNNEFKCVWDIANDVDTSSDKIPPLLLQPYIENAIWHGLLHKEGERILTIRIAKNKDTLLCTIEDNGIGRAAAAAITKNKIHHESLGTKITQKRIDLINSLNKSGIGVQYFDLRDAAQVACGTRVQLTIPYVGNYQ